MQWLSKKRKKLTAFQYRITHVTPDNIKILSTNDNNSIINEKGSRKHEYGSQSFTLLKPLDQLVPS